MLLHRQKGLFRLRKGVADVVLAWGWRCDEVVGENRPSFVR